MTVESATYISDLNASNPGATDTIPEGDDHLRLIKSTVKATFPNISGAVTPTHTELNYVDGVTSAIQAQLDAKAPLASPTLTGTPAAPTAAVGTSTTQIATTAFVQANQGMVLLSTVTASAAATADVETTFDSTYDAYMIVATGLVGSSAQPLYCRFKVGGAYSSANYSFHCSTSTSGSATPGGAVGSGTNQIQVSNTAVGTAASDTGHFVMHLSNVASTSLQKVASWDGVLTSGSTAAVVQGAGLNTSTSALTGVRFLLASGNISGTFRLYGIKKS